MEARLVRDELDKCHRTEGVNHYENCKVLSQRYVEMLKENRVRPVPCAVSCTLRTNILYKVKGYKNIDV